MFEKLFTRHAELLKAVAHPHRLEIINLLRDEELCVSDIHAMLDLRQANISQHLQILREAGVVSSRQKGKQRYYRIAHSGFITASDAIRQVLIDENAKQDREVPELQLSMSQLVPIVHDPVCAMRLSPRTASYSLQYKHNTFHFCASGCLKKFKENPKKYAST